MPEACGRGSAVAMTCVNSMLELLQSWSSQRVQLVDTSSGCDVKTGVGGSPRATGRAKQQARKQNVTNVNRNTSLLSRVAQVALRLMEVLAPSRRQMDENVLSIFRTRTLDTSLVLDVARWTLEWTAKPSARQLRRFVEDGVCKVKNRGS